MVPVDVIDEMNWFEPPAFGTTHIEFWFGIVTVRVVAVVMPDRVN